LSRVGVVGLEVELRRFFRILGFHHLCGGR
jgi:hypothetical protein